MKSVLKLLPLLLCLLCLGCTPIETPAPTSSTAPQRAGLPGTTPCARILQDIWGKYDPEDQFIVYGGMLRQPVSDAPGDLDMEQFPLWLSQYHLPANHQENLLEGASLHHLLDSNLFTAVAFRVNPESLASLARDWRLELLKSHWVNEPPERLLLAKIDEKNLVMCFGSRHHTKNFQRMLLYAFPSAKILSSQPIPL